MKKRPISIYILTALHLLAPLFTVVFSRVVKSQPLVWDTLFTPESIAANWPGYILPIIGGVCIYLCKKWSMFVYLICMAALLFVSFSNFSSEASRGSLTLLTLVWLINIGVVMYFLRPALRQVYTDPKIRWWEHSKRFNCSLPVKFNQDQNDGDGEILNISKTGLLLKTSTPLTDKSNIKISAQINGVDFLPLTGEVIIHKQIENGCGIKFDNSSGNKKSAKQIIKSLRA